MWRFKYKQTRHNALLKAEQEPKLAGIWQTRQALCTLIVPTCSNVCPEIERVNDSGDHYSQLGRCHGCPLDVTYRSTRCLQSNTFTKFSLQTLH